MRIFFLLFICSNFLFSENSLNVFLPTDSKLKKLKVASIENNKGIFSKQYYQQIQEVLYFDLNHCGYVHLSQEKSAPYEIKMQATQSDLHVTAINKNLGKIYRLQPVHLSGHIDKDRTLIHKISDNIILKIFSQKGISTTKILYSNRKKITTKNKERWISEIWVCDYDGQNAQQITYNKGYNVTPYYIPIQSREGFENFLYVSYRNGQPKIYRASFADPQGKTLFTLPGNQLLPSVSFTSDMVAFVCDVAGTSDIFIQKYTPYGEPIDKPKQIFSYPKSTHATPSFHPTGSSLSFVSDKDGPPRIYTIDISSLNTTTRPDAHLITKKNRHNSSPSWSSDGKKLAYCAKTDNVWQIWVYNADTGEENQLTFDRKNKENPRWAPNSLHLVYNTEDTITSEMYIINLNQMRPIQISHGPGNKRFPVWEPIQPKRG